MKSSDAVVDSTVTGQPSQTPLTYTENESQMNI